ncbi:MAG: inositol monophosphatase family protein [Chloroflexi bacterium]|nr:inositol monophosphatase family protein [Chloroflexota bacterium]
MIQKFPETGLPSVDAADLRARLEFAVGAARAAGEHALGYFQTTDLVIDRKDDASPVTRADREAEELIRRNLAEAFPDDAVLGEEFGEQSGTTGFRWYLDPVDGTESFVRGVPLWGPTIGLERDGEPAAGVIAFPALHEIVWAGTGLGAWWANNVKPIQDGETFPDEPRRARVSNVSDIGDACMSVTSVKGFDEVGTFAGYDRLRRVAGMDRGWGDCYGYLLVATGRIDIHIDPQMNIWDVAPMLTIIEEAGGRATDRDGNRGIDLANLVATNGLLHDHVLELLTG